MRGKLRHFSTFMAYITLAACGGESGQSGSYQPSPPPTNSPAPTPPPPPPPSSPATIFSVVAIGPMISNVVIDTNNNGLFTDSENSSSATTLNGDFGRDSGVEPRFTFGLIPTSPDFMMEALGRDSLTGFGYSQMRAPAGAIIVSPLSSLIAAHGDERVVRTSLGLDSGLDRLQTQVNLLTFHPSRNINNVNPSIAHDAGRITSINLQLLALATLLKDTNGDPVDWGAPLDRSSQYLAELIREGVELRLTERAIILAALKKSAYRTSGDRNLGLMADYLATYFRAIPSIINEPAVARAWMYEFHFGVLADIKWPDLQHPAFVIPNEAGIANRAQGFLTAPAPQIGPFYAVTDYRELTYHDIPALNYRARLAYCAPPLALPGCNDFISDYTGIQTLPDQPAARVIAVAPEDTSSLSVILNSDGTLDLARVGQFTGLTYFTYIARLPTGAQATGRTYVRVRPRL